MKPIEHIASKLLLIDKLTVKWAVKPEVRCLVVDEVEATVALQMGEIYSVLSRVLEPMFRKAGRK